MFGAPPYTGTLTLGTDGSAVFKFPTFSVGFGGSETGSREFSRFVERNRASMGAIIAPDTCEVKLTPDVEVVRFPKPRR